MLYGIVTVPQLTYQVEPVGTIALIGWGILLVSGWTYTKGTWYVTVTGAVP